MIVIIMIIIIKKTDYFCHLVMTGIIMNNTKEMSRSVEVSNDHDSMMLL